MLLFEITSLFIYYFKKTINSLRKTFTSEVYLLPFLTTDQQWLLKTIKYKILDRTLLFYLKSLLYFKKNARLEGALIYDHALPPSLPEMTSPEVKNPDFFSHHDVNIPKIMQHLVIPCWTYSVIIPLPWIIRRWVFPSSHIRVSFRF